MKGLESEKARIKKLVVDQALDNAITYFTCPPRCGDRL